VRRDHLTVCSIRPVTASLRGRLSVGVEASVAIMTPEERRAASEALLKERGIPLNLDLPLIEADEDVTLRSPEEVLHRLIALWAVVGTSFLKETPDFRNYLVQRKLETWLSPRERAFLLADSRSEDDCIQYTWKLECLYFLAWCARLVECIEIPCNQSNVDSIVRLFPQETEDPVELQQAIRIRSKDEIMAWADLLYRLHWAVRDARLSNRQEPHNVDGSVVKEWHLAVNWMIRYNGQDNWDDVTTDT
jgi:hypothetical protein